MGRGPASRAKSAACLSSGACRRRRVRAPVPLDLYEDKANAYVRAELPGISRDDIQVELADGTLTITATRKTPATEGQPERSFPVSRAVTLPDEVQADKIGAAYENGVLTVTLPKREEVQPKKITVAVK